MSIKSGQNSTEFSLLRQFDSQMQVLNFSQSCLNGNELPLVNANKARKGMEKQEVRNKNSKFRARGSLRGMNKTSRRCSNKLKEKRIL